MQAHRVQFRQLIVMGSQYRLGSRAWHSLAQLVMGCPCMLSPGLGVQWMNKRRHFILRLLIRHNCPVSSWYRISSATSMAPASSFVLCVRSSLPTITSLFSFPISPRENAFLSFYTSFVRWMLLENCRMQAIASIWVMSTHFEICSTLVESHGT